MALPPRRQEIRVDNAYITEFSASNSARHVGGVYRILQIPAANKLSGGNRIIIFSTVSISMRQAQ